VPPVVVAVEATVRVEVTALVLAMLTGVGRPQVIGLVAPVGAVVTAQLRSTPPVNPLTGVTEMVEVFPVVAPGEMLMVVGLLVIVKPGAVVPLTIAVMPSVWTYKPLASVPVTSTL
jgi:hypothetical protein